MNPLLSPLRPVAGQVGAAPGATPLDGQAGAGAEPSAAAVHLLRRASFGPTRSTLLSVATLGPQRWLEVQLSPESFADRDVDALLPRFPGITLPISELRDQVRAGRIDPDQVIEGLGQASLVRSLWSRRQLLEVMVEVWSTHFNVPLDQATWDSRADYDSTVRGSALGRFGDLLVAVTTHPAMLRFMATESSGSGSNEHHGRELLELHTVGPEAAVTEDEVRSSARILTGLTLDPGSGELVYRPDLHQVGPVSVQGLNHPNPSGEAGFDLLVGYLQYLARRPATARRVARLLAVRFVADRPPAALVDRLAKVYLASDTSIAPVLRALFGSAEFAASSGTKVRRPLEDLAAAVRALGIGPDRAGTQGISGLYWQLSALGQAPLGCSRPAGYSQRGTDWLSAAVLVGRWNAHQGLAGGWWPVGLSYPGWRALLPADLPAGYGDVVDALAARVVLSEVSRADRASLCAAVGRRPGDAATAASLAIDVPQLVALLLDSPSHCVC